MFWFCCTSGLRNTIIACVNKLCICLMCTPATNRQQLFMPSHVRCECTPASETTATHIAWCMRTHTWLMYNTYNSIVIYNTITFITFTQLIHTIVWCAHLINITTIPAMCAKIISTPVASPPRVVKRVRAKRCRRVVLYVFLFVCVCTKAKVLRQVSAWFICAKTSKPTGECS